MEYSPLTPSDTPPLHSLADLAANYCRVIALADMLTDDEAET